MRVVRLPELYRVLHFDMRFWFKAAAISNLEASLYSDSVKMTSYHEDAMEHRDITVMASMESASNLESFRLFG
jgi:hypoxanthine-guanine phosphoribosyltransferase